HQRADLLAEWSERLRQMGHRPLLIAARREADRLVGAGDPLARALAHLGGQATIAVVGHEAVLVLTNELRDLQLLPLESLQLLELSVGVVAEEVAAGVRAQLLERLHHGRGDLQARDLRLRHETAALLDLVEAYLHEHAESDQRGERNAEQDE